MMHYVKYKGFYVDSRDDLTVSRLKKNNRLDVDELLLSSP